MVFIKFNLKPTMEKIVLMLICFFATGNHHLCKGQNVQQTIDSLLMVLNHANEDTGRVNTLNLLSKNYRSLSETDNSKKYAEDALRIAEKIKFKKGNITALLNIGNLLYKQSNYPEALKNFFAAFQISQETGNKQGIANSQKDIANVYYAQGNYPEALKNYNAALNFYGEIKDSMSMAICYSNTGNVYDNQGNYPEALDSYYAALKIAEQKGNKLLIANTSGNIGVVYWHQGSHSEALKAYFSALAIHEEIENKSGMSACYANIGMIYADQDKLTEAKDYSLRSLAIDEALDDKAGIAYQYCSIGNISYKQENYPEALENFFNALQLSQEIGDTIQAAVAYTGLGRTYDKLGKFNEAEANLSKALFLAKAIGAKHAMVEIYKRFTEIYKKRNDFKNAYRYHDLFYQMNDSIFNEVKSQQIAELKIQYETEVKENEIALLSKDQALHLVEIKKQKMLKSFFMGGLALTALLGFLGYKYFRNTQKLKVQTLRNKIASDLHDDVGGTLTSIRLYSEIAKKQTKDQQVSVLLDKIGRNAGEIIHSMSDIVWMINPKYDTFGSVLSRMENFAAEILAPQEIQYTIKKDTDVENLKLSMETRQNIFMIFKEAIHNAAKHADCQTVSIHLSRSKDQLQMNITDDGSGFDERAIQRGNGLSSMESRAAGMHGTITVAASPGRGTSVTLNMFV